VRRAANTLGIWGTPALTIGRTLVMGDIPAKTLDLLIEDETATPAGAC
jgi:protein-disulfide isomerase